MSDDYKEIRMNGEKMLCPSGYELVEQEHGRYRCEGGGHEYDFNTGDIFQDKAGRVWVKHDPVADSKEAK